MNMKTLITLKSGVEIRCFEDAENIYADLHGTMMFASVAAEEARIAVLIGKAAGLPDKEVDHTVMSREWLLDKFMQLEGFDELLDGLKQEAIDKAIQAAGDINDEYADNSEVPRVEDVINDFFASKPNVRTYLNIRPLRAAFRNLVSTAA